MLRLATLLVFGSAIALGQSRLELLQKVADHYKNSDTFRVEGTASAMIPGTSWRGMYEFKTEAAQPDFLPLNLRGPSIRESTLVHKASLVQTKETATDSKPKAEFGMVPFGRYVELTRRLVDAQKVGEETITVGGKTYSCKLIDVTYDYSPAFKPNSMIEHQHLAIDPANLLVLRETRHAPDVGEWTAEVTSFSFNEPPSEAMLKGLSAVADAPKTRPEWIGRPAPELTLKQLSGEPVRLSDQRGRFVLLDFWGSYCGPCRRVTQHAQELGGRYRSLTVLTLTQDSADDAKRWTDFYQINLPVVLDPERVAFNAFDVEGIPVAILLDREGKVAHYWRGLDDLTSLDSVLAATIQEPPPQSR